MNIPAGFGQFQRNAGIWAEDKDSFFEEIQPRKGQEKAYNAIKEMTEGERRLLVLVGESRSGKSWLSAGYVNSMLCKYYGSDTNKSARYMTFFEMELMLRTAMTLGTMEKLFADLLRPNQLVIDELGRGKWSEFTSTFFTNLILKTYGELKDTLIATNLNAVELRDMLDLAFIERLKEQNGIVLIQR